MTDHTWFKCEQPCEKMSCIFCDGGLGWCTACDGFEGTLPSECPGRRMTASESEDVYAGKLDYRGGQWVHQPSGLVSSHSHPRDSDG